MITVFGTVCIDRIYRVPRLPDVGGYVEVESELTVLGGEAANTAAALKKWGADVKLIANPVGCDDDGKMLLALLDNAGLPSKGKIWGNRTPVCDIFVTPDGERTMIGRGFSSMDGADIDLGELGAGEWFTAEPNMAKTARESVKKAQAAGMKTYLMDFIRDEDSEIISKCDVWQSSTDWAGKRGSAKENLDFVRNHTNKFGCISILTDGDNGIYLAEMNQEPKHLAAVQAETVVDVTGAGDIFRAGMLYGLDEEWSLLKCAALAAAAGALECRGLGAIAAIPDLDEVVHLMESAKYE